MIKAITIPKYEYADDIVYSINQKMSELEISDDQIIGIVSNSYSLEMLLLYKEAGENK